MNYKKPPSDPKSSSEFSEFGGIIAVELPGGYRWFLCDFRDLQTDLTHHM